MAKYSDKLNVPKEGKKITLKFHGVLCVPGPVHSKVTARARGVIGY